MNEQSNTLVWPATWSDKPDDWQANGGYINCYPKDIVPEGTPNIDDMEEAIQNVTFED